MHSISRLLYILLNKALQFVKSNQKYVCQVKNFNITLSIT